MPEPLTSAYLDMKVNNLQAISDVNNSGQPEPQAKGVNHLKSPSDNCTQLTGPPPVLSEVVTCNCVRNPGGNAKSNTRPSEEGVSFYLVL